MLVRQAKNIARQWVNQKAAQSPGFHGAFFHGSVNWLSEDAHLPPISDVDVMIVMDGPILPVKLGKFLHRGVILEVSYLPRAEVASAEQVSGISHLAGSFHTASIIADPTGQLTRLQAAVAKDYHKREWVMRRCAHARDKALAHLEGLSEAEPLHDQVNHWLFGAGVTTHILLAAGLKNPTVRTRYLAVRDLLSEYDRLHFYETLLKLLGCDQMSQSRASQHLASLSEAFDAAQGVIHTPFPFSADISELARPVAIDGSRDLIERGDHREAVFWMAVTYTRCQKVLYHDSPGELHARHTPGYHALLADLGIRPFEDLNRRCEAVRESLPGVWAVAEAILAENHAIED